MRRGPLVLEPAAALGDDLDAVHGGVERAHGAAELDLAGAQQGLAAGLEGAEDREHARGVLEDHLGGVGDRPAIVDGVDAAASRDGGGAVSPTIQRIASK